MVNELGEDSEMCLSAFFVLLSLLATIPWLSSACKLCVFRVYGPGLHTSILAPSLVAVSLVVTETCSFTIQNTVCILHKLCPTGILSQPSIVGLGNHREFVALFFIGFWFAIV